MLPASPMETGMFLSPQVLSLPTDAGSTETVQRCVGGQGQTVLGGLALTLAFEACPSKVCF